MATSVAFLPILRKECLMPQALDLSREFPRSPFDAVAGYFWLPRLIDKARAFFAGTHGEYTPYPCPADKRFLDLYGLDAEALGDVIRGGASDDEVAAWVQKHQVARTLEEVAEFVRAQALPPADPGVAAYLAEQAKALAPERTDIDSFAKLICLEENHPFPSFLG